MSSIKERIYQTLNASKTSELFTRPQPNSTKIVIEEQIRKLREEITSLSLLIEDIRKEGIVADGFSTRKKHIQNHH